MASNQWLNRPCGAKSAPFVGVPFVTRVMGGGGPPPCNKNFYKLEPAQTIPQGAGGRYHGYKICFRCYEEKVYIFQFCCVKHPTLKNTYILYPKNKCTLIKLFPMFSDKTVQCFIKLYSNFKPFKNIILHTRNFKIDQHFLRCFK